MYEHAGRALQPAQPAFPHLNARCDDVPGIVRHCHPLDVGISAQTPRGLIASVVRDGRRRHHAGDQQPGRRDHDINKIVDRPVTRDDRIEVAGMMDRSSYFDHDVANAWDTASFIQQLRTAPETPALLFA